MKIQALRERIGPRVGAWGVATMVALGLYGVWMPLAGFERFRAFVDAAEVVSLIALLAGAVSATLAFRLSPCVTRGVRRALLIGTALALISSGAFVHYVFVLSADLPEAPSIATGEPAPEIIGKDFLDQEFSLAELRGNPVVLVFYRGHW